VNGYDIVSTLGSGSFGKVCRVLRRKDGALFAMKIVPKSNLGNEADWARFQREVDVMHGLKHPNIIQLHDFFENGDSFHLVIDLCNDGELTNYIIKNDKLTEPTAVTIFSQIVSAIGACHANGVAHRDLKPENILIAKFPTIKVADFGLCGFHSTGELMNTFCGSPAYAAPECLMRQEYDGTKSDLWSLGVILYVMVTGCHPWDITNTSTMIRQIMSAEFTVPASVSPACREMIRGLIQVNPDARTPVSQLARHAWFRLASQTKGLGRTGGPNLPSLAMPHGHSSSNLLSARSKDRDPFQILSPFEAPSITPIAEQGGEGILPRQSPPTPLVLAGLATIARGRRASIGAMAKYSSKGQSGDFAKTQNVRNAILRA
jgi:serine/threonine protein kinase